MSEQATEALKLALLLALLLAAAPPLTRTYTFTIPHTGYRTRCADAETLYTIDSVRVRRFARMPHPYDGPAWHARQGEAPQMLFQAGCRAGDSVTVTVAKGDTGDVDEIAVHNTVLLPSGQRVGAWGDACGATWRAW